MDGQAPNPAPGPSALFLGAVGLGLLIGGWAASTWSPPREGAQLFEEVRRLAGDSELGRRLESYRPRPPLEWPGRIVFFVGLGLFIAAGFRMANPPASTEDSPQNPPEASKEIPSSASG
jgi:hypothetical protein